MRKSILYLISVLSAIMLTGTTSCIEKIVDKKRIAPKDYRQFQGTPVWPLAKAIWKEDMDEMKAILDRNPELMEIKDSLYGNTVLMFTIMNQQYKPFKELLERGANINYYNVLDGSSPILEASCYKRNKPEFVEELIKYGADVNDTRELGFADHGERGWTSLMFASLCGNLKIVQTLVRNKANINYTAEYDKTTALGVAILAGQYDVAFYLLSSGAKYDMPITHRRDRKGNFSIPMYIGEALRKSTPPIMAFNTFLRKRDVIKFLYQRGYDYDTVPIPNSVKINIKNMYPYFWKYYLKYY